MNSSAENHHQKDSRRPPPSNQPFDQTSAAGNPVIDPHWSTGLCDCCQDFGTCCLTCWCPCITFGRIVDILERGSTSCVTSGAVYTLISLVTGCACLYSWCYRTKLRGQYHLHGNHCTDCLTHCFCETCALCQEYRELKRRGFDMEIGWNANVEQQTRGVTTLPPNVTGGMSRQ